MRQPKTLGEVAHDAGKKAGGWERKWEHMRENQQAEWEAIAQAVIDEKARRDKEHGPDEHCEDYGKTCKRCGAAPLGECKR